jgi:hypothetical protein
MRLLLKLESPLPEVKEKLKEINHLLTELEVEDVIKPSLA